MPFFSSLPRLAGVTLALLWADRDPVRHGTAQEMGHGVCVICGVKCQPSLLGILLQQPQPFQATAYTLTNQLNQGFQLIFVRCSDTLKSWGTVVTIDVHAIQKQDVKMDRAAFGLRLRADPKRCISVTAPVAPALHFKPALCIR